jgi:hypothetical protein
MNRKARHVYDLDRVMDVKEAADLFGVSQKQINTWIGEDRLELYQIPGISSRMVVVPRSISQFIDQHEKDGQTAVTATRSARDAGSGGPSEQEGQNIDRSFLEAASTLLKTVEQIKGLVDKGTIIAIDGKLTPKSVATYKEFLQS